jgi:hypothetical protein
MDPEIASRILNFKSSDKEKDTLYWISRLLLCPGVVDRTGKLNQFNTHYSPIPDVGAFDKSFSTVCLETAENLWKCNDTIEVSWSGGIDSTAVALALLETKTPEKKLIIGCTMHSIIEYPKFYETYKDICKMISNKNFFSQERFETEHLVVTGDVGDQLWGSNLIANLSEKELYKKDEPWQSLLDWPDIFNQLIIPLPDFRPVPLGWHIAREPWTREQKNKFIDILTSHALSCPFEIKTCFDMAWWINFSTKVNHVSFNMANIAAYNNGLKYINLNNFIPFYLNDDFQRWSLINHDKKNFSTKLHYKQLAKEFIYSINQDADYIKNKSKDQSTFKMLDPKWASNYRKDINANYAIMSDGTIYSNKNDMPVDVIECIMRTKLSI